MTKDSNPTIQECYQLMTHYRMLPNIIEHSEQVMRVALVIVDNLCETSHINRDIIVSAALLHDIMKTQAITTKEQHDITGGILLRELGYDQVAIVVEEHVILNSFDEDSPLEEREIIYYSDKRVMHNTIVSTEERITDIIKRYGHTKDRIKKITEDKELILKVEKKISRNMKVDIHKAIDALSRP